MGSVAEVLAKRAIQRKAPKVEGVEIHCSTPSILRRARLARDFREQTGEDLGRKGFEPNPAQLSVFTVCAIRAVVDDDISLEEAAGLSDASLDGSEDLCRAAIVLATEEEVSAPKDGDEDDAPFS